MKKNINNRYNKMASSLVILSLVTQISASFAAETVGTSEFRPELQGALDPLEVKAEIQKHLEADTPGIAPSFADKLLESSEKNLKADVAQMLTDFKVGVEKGWRLARDGNGTIVVIGTKKAAALLKKYGTAAGIHYRDSVYMLPEKVKGIGHDFAEAGRKSVELAKRDFDFSAETVKRDGEKIAGDWQDAVREYGEIGNWMGRSYKKEGQAIGDAFVDGYQDAKRWSGDVWDWTKKETKESFQDLTSDPVDYGKATGRWTKKVGKFFVDETVDSFKSIGGWSGNVWDFTWENTGRSWNATKNATHKVFDETTGLAGDLATWLNKNTTAPLRQAGTAIEDVSSWNWKKGWTQGVKEGHETAAQAWKNEDRLMATLWEIQGIGKGALHVLLLEPTLVPLIAAYGVSGTAALATLGYPSVGAMYGFGAVGAGLTFAGGAVGTAAFAAGGTIASGVAGGLGTVRTIGTAGIGIAATGATFAGGIALTAGITGYDATRMLGTPIIGGMGMTGSVLAGAAEALGKSTFEVGKMAGVTALGAGGFTVVSSIAASQTVFHAVHSAGAAVYDNAILTPVGVVMNLAQALGTGTWRLAEDPIEGTIDVMAASGIFVGTLVTSTGAFTYEALKGSLFGLGNGIAAVGQSGLFIVGAVAKGVEYVTDMFNIPQHHEWAAFRKGEVDEALARIIEDSPQDLAKRYGDVILTRVHWWGEETGHVRFFITKNKETGERWFFKRTVDPATCEVKYLITNKDPVVRAFQKTAWSGNYETGLYYKGCVAKSEASGASH